MRWRFEEEHAYHLTRPEIARDVVSVTKKLADSLGLLCGGVRTSDSTSAGVNAT
ncbi:hypothetical protein KSF_003800 [Reticulibacter mediterranei]|uniref:Uncharacterized protein n=1 Tax=Reticulibacter mediterranei TaxID=2778369 RepID=A0A8J3N0J1_9CHLR|nr:hypothetical protein KSF_003800 [Reticulibacter mediterranei]